MKGNIHSEMKNPKKLISNDISTAFDNFLTASWDNFYKLLSTVNFAEILQCVFQALLQSFSSMTTQNAKLMSWRNISEIYPIKNLWPELNRKFTAINVATYQNEEQSWTKSHLSDYYLLRVKLMGVHTCTVLTHVLFLPQYTSFYGGSFGHAPVTSTIWQKNNT